MKWLTNMNPLNKGLLVAVIHLAMVCSLGAKLLIDRATRPRLWVKTVAFDPYDPLRGRYISVSLEVDAPNLPATPTHGDYYDAPRARLEVVGDRLHAVPDADGQMVWQIREKKAVWPVTIAFFIPEHAIDPSIRRDRAELWAEVTIPKKGPPRPIRLALKQPDGRWEELNLR